MNPSSPNLSHLTALVVCFLVIWQLITLLRIGRLERKLDLLGRPQGAKPLKLSERVKQLAEEPGRKIEAIKAYREETGAGLKEAKDAVEEYMSLQMQ